MSPSKKQKIDHGGLVVPYLRNGASERCSRDADTKSTKQDKCIKDMADKIKKQEEQIKKHEDKIAELEGNIEGMQGPPERVDNTNDDTLNTSAEVNTVNAMASHVANASGRD